jgi:hypothetical protein
MIKTIVILIVLIPNIAFSSDYLKYKDGADNEKWNSLVKNYYNSIPDVSNWRKCINRTPMKLDGMYRRVVECYTEEEVNRFNDYNLILNEEINRVFKSCIRNIWDHADAVDGTIIMQTSNKVSQRAADAMTATINDCKLRRIPIALSKAFKEENERFNLNKAISLAKQRKVKEEQAKKDKKINFSSKSLLKKLLNKE